MTLEQCIIEILDNFSPQEYFDSHTVINIILSKKKYHLVYLRSFSSGSTVAQYHGNIGKMIGSSKMAVQAGKAKTHTIYGDLSENVLWKKV